MSAWHRPLGCGGARSRRSSGRLLTLRAAVACLCLPAVASAASPGGSQVPPLESPPEHAAAATPAVCCGGPISIPSIYLHSGEFHHCAVDLVIPGRGLDFVWARRYRSRSERNHRMGPGWDFSYNLRVTGGGNGVRVFDGNGRSDLFRPDAQGRYVARELFCSGDLAKDGRFTLTFPDHGQWRFLALDGRPAAGRIDAIVDRNGNALRFTYDASGRLATVIDTLGRTIKIGYDPNGNLATVSDFAGREVVYDYFRVGDIGGSPGDLKSARSPIVTGTPNGNDFPAGKTTHYGYSTGFADPRLDHNLLTITDPKGQTWLVNEYASTEDPGSPLFDRVVAQTRGDPGDRIDVSYVVVDAAAGVGPAGSAGRRVKAIVNDRVGNVKEFEYDPDGRCVSVREFTGRADPDLPTTETGNRPQHPLRPGDPACYETRYAYNADARVTRIVHPNGNVTERAHERDVSPGGDPRSRGNLLALTRLPGSHVPAGDQAVLVETFEYEPGFGGCCGRQFVTRHVDARGHATEHDHDAAGNRVQTRHRIASIVEDWAYNAFGQLVRHTWPDNGSGQRQIDDFEYYGVADGAQNGYLRRKVADAGVLSLATSFRYDAVGNVVARTDPRGLTTDFVVNALDQVVQEVSPPVTMHNGAVVRNETLTSYDANDNLVRIDVLNVDDQGQLSANAWITTSYTHETLNRRASRRQERDGFHDVVEEYEYDANRNPTLLRKGEATLGTQPENVVRHLWDERDLLFRTIRGEGDPGQSTTQFDYDGNGNLIARSAGIEDDAPRVTFQTFDGYDRMVARVDPMGNASFHGYDENGNLASRVVEGELCDVEGGGMNVRLYQEAFDHDAMDRWTLHAVDHFDAATQAPLGDGKSQFSMTYTDRCRPAEFLDDGGNATKFAYDSANRPALEIDARGNRREFLFDGNGNLAGIRETELSDRGDPARVYVTSFAHDAVDRKVSMTDPAGNETRLGYDSRHNETLRIDPRGNLTRRAFDGLDRLIATTRILTDDGTGNGAPIGEIVVAQSFDDSSRLVARTDPQGNTTSNVYDPLDRITAVSYADGTSETFEFDVHGNPVQQVDANGSLLRDTFDRLDRMVARSIVPGSGVRDDTTFEVFKYDGLSRLVEALDDDSQVVRSYDSLSRLTTELQNGHAFSYVHDGMGNRLLLTYPGGKQVSAKYDALHRLVAVTNAGPAASYSYVGPERVEECTTGADAVTSDYGYDDARRMVRSDHVTDVADVDRRTYAWDAASNKAASSDVRPGGPGLSHLYTHDSQDRMVRSLVRRPDGSVERDTAYAFDAAGNRTSVTGDACPGTYVMDATQPEPADRQMNQYTTTPCLDLAHDRNGSAVLLDGAVELCRDDRDQLVARLADAAKTTYRYDALGRRIAKTHDTGAAVTTIAFYYDGWRLCEERDGEDQVAATYVYGREDQLVEMTRGGQTWYYVADELGSIRALTDDDGKVVERYEYADYGAPSFFDGKGNPLAASDAQNPFLFTSQYFDPESSLYWFKTRSLHPGIGRFLSRDRIGLWGDPIHLGNGVAYAGNNPATWRDPFGLDTQGKKPVPGSWGAGEERELVSKVSDSGMQAAMLAIALALLKAQAGGSGTPPPDGSSTGLAPDMKDFLERVTNGKGSVVTVDVPFHNTYLGLMMSEQGKGLHTQVNPNPEDFLADLAYDAGLGGGAGGINLNGGGIQEQIGLLKGKGKGKSGPGGDSDGNDANRGHYAEGEDWPGPPELVNPVPIAATTLRLRVALD